jgi:hypothetical protein
MSTVETSTHPNNVAATPDAAIVPSLVRKQTSEPGPVVVPAAELSQILVWWDKVQAVKAALIDPKEDVVLIQGKSFVKKPGWRKLAFAYNLADEIVKEVKETDDKRTVWRMWVRITAPNGRSVVGVASAASDEKRFAHADHDVYALCHTRAKNRAISDILGLGEVSFEEMASGEPTKTVEETSSNGGSSPEALDSLPWKAMTKKPHGSWIYSNLPEASRLVEALTNAADKTLTLGSYTYTISGQDGKFVNRWPHKEEG